MEKDASLFSSLDMAIEKKVYVPIYFLSTILEMVKFLVYMVILSMCIMCLASVKFYC